MKIIERQGNTRRIDEKQANKSKQVSKRLEGRFGMIFDQRPSDFDVFPPPPLFFFCVADRARVRHGGVRRGVEGWGLDLAHSSHN